MGPVKIHDPHIHPNVSGSVDGDELVPHVRKKMGGKAQGVSPHMRLDRKGGGRLTAHDRQSLPKSSFALPGHGKGPKGAGAGSYPIPDPSHARSALSRVAQHGSSSEKAKVRAAVHRKYPGIGKD
jgi:hypothetical protein